MEAGRQYGFGRVDRMFGHESIGVGTRGRGKAKGHWLVGKFTENDERPWESSVGRGIEQVAYGAVENGGAGR